MESAGSLMEGFSEVIPLARGRPTALFHGVTLDEAAEPGDVSSLVRGEISAAYWAPEAGGRGQDGPGDGVVVVDGVVPGWGGRLADLPSDSRDDVGGLGTAGVGFDLVVSADALVAAVSAVARVGFKRIPASTGFGLVGHELHGEY